MRFVHIDPLTPSARDLCYIAKENRSGTLKKWVLENTARSYHLFSRKSFVIETLQLKSKMLHGMK